MEKENLPEIYSNIQNSINNDDHDAVLKYSEKILLTNKNEKEAQKCKIISLINLNRFDECDQYISKNSLKNEYPEEYMYCLIEKKDYSECEKFISGLSKPTPNLDVINAQLNYKKGDYILSHKILKKNLDSNISNEDYITNYLAVYFLSNSNENIDLLLKYINSWEAYFNYCLILLNQGKFGESMETLLQMSNMKTDDDYNDLKLKNLQFSIIQTCFDGFDISKTTSLQEEYSRLLKEKEKHKSFQPYFYNNFLHSKKEKDSLNETLKKLENFLLQDHLTKDEKYVINLNRVILLLRANKFNEAVKEFSLIKENQNDLRYILVNCFLIIKSESYEAFEKKVENEYKQIPEVHLILLQTLLSSISIKNIDTFHLKLIAFVKNFFEFAQNFHFINFFVNFYETKHLKVQLKEFISLFSDCNKFTKGKKFGIHLELDKSLFSMLGLTFLKSGLYKEASDFLKLILRDIDPYCKETKFYLINSLAHINNDEADSLIKQMENLKVNIQDEYISELLSSAFSSQKKDKTEKVKTTKKKKKNKHTKVYDPNAPLPDPERWLPKNQRKKYKNLSKNKKNYQGAAADNTTTTSTFKR